LAQFSPESGSCDFGLVEGLEDAQAAEITSDARVRTRTPSFFFMATPLQNRTRPIRGSGRSTPPCQLGLRPLGFFRNSLDSRRARKGDWIAFFERRLGGQPWPGVVVEWVPLLSPGIIAAAFHGVIRTAHAVRSLETVETPARRRELAEGLGYRLHVRPQRAGILISVDEDPRRIREPSRSLLERHATPSSAPRVPA
jgi:hypothetical protein